jgi:CDP-diacylglycerol--glycerol-3-phosphate 3-phosphatidyltransferase
MGLTFFELRVLTVLLAFFAVQTVGFAVFQNFYHLPRVWNWAFYVLSAVYHGLLWLGLWSVRRRFTTLEGQPLTKLGLPNLLTLFRLTSLPIITLVFLSARTHPSLSLPLVVFVSVAFLTDLLDGFLARTFKMGTTLGQLLDSSTDYVILFSLTVVLAFSGVLPLYLLILILVRLGTQIGLVIWVQASFQRQFVETTWLGKASLFVLMVLFAVEILVFLRLPGWEGHWAITSLEVFAGAAMVVSTVDKLVFFRKKLKAEHLI